MGRIYIHLHGKPKDKSIYSLIKKYSTRLESESIRIIEHSENLSPTEYLVKLEKNVKNAELILFDQNGIEYSSLDFSNVVKSWKLNSEDTHLAIGPAIGFPNNDFSKVSLSKMTFPHELAAVFLVEQVYRSMQIIKGTKYHK
jgi:23S rRNA (pseudouridine1915-N3)-methyltransferase